MASGGGLRPWARRATLITVLLVAAGLLLLVGVLMRVSGLEEAANVAQLVSVLFAVPSVAVPVLDWYQRSRVRTEDVDPVLHVKAELREASYVITDEPARVPASGHLLRVTVETAEASAVILGGLRVEVVSRRPPSGEYAPHAGALRPRLFDLRLDPEPPTIAPSGDGPDFPFTISATDPEVFDIRVHLDHGDVSWRLLVDWGLRGRTGTLVVDAAARPFRTMSVPGSP
jgi:hypothetical protein